METGKLATVSLEINRLVINVLGLSEVGWSSAGQCYYDRVVLYYSRTSTDNQRNSVGIMIKSEIESHVFNFVPYNDQIIMIQLKAHPLNTNISDVCPNI